jgi:hypothetical protein
MRYNAVLGDTICLQIYEPKSWPICDRFTYHIQKARRADGVSCLVSECLHTYMPTHLECVPFTGATMSPGLIHRRVDFMCPFRFPSSLHMSLSAFMLTSRKPASLKLFR